MAAAGMEPKDRKPMAGRGYVKLHREVIGNPLFAHDGLFRLWCFCLIRANWQDCKMLVPGTLSEITVKRGQFITGRESLHSHLYGNLYRGDSKPTSRTVWNWLKFLEEIGCIKTQNVSSRCTLVTICKYGTYQDEESGEFPADFQASALHTIPHNVPHTIPPASTNKEEQEYKKPRNKETKKGNTPKPPVAIADVTFPTALDTPEVRNALDRWLEYKRIRGEGYKAAWFVNHLLADFAPFGPVAFVQAVGKSIGSNYAGLFQPKGQNGQAAGPLQLPEDA